MLGNTKKTDLGRSYSDYKYIFIDYRSSKYKRISGCVIYGNKVDGFATVTSIFLLLG